MICEQCQNQFICVGKHFRDLLIDGMGHKIKIDAIQRAVAENCSEFKEFKEDD